MKNKKNLTLIVPAEYAEPIRNYLKNKKKASGMSYQYIVANILMRVVEKNFI